MKISLRTLALGLIAICSGLVGLLGYIIHIPAVQNLQSVFLGWAMVLSAVALGVGVINLIRVHFHKLQSKSNDRLFSLVLLVSFCVAFLVAVITGLTSPLSLWIFESVLIPIETSLVAILVILLIYALVHMFYRKVSLMGLVFTATVFIMLAITAVLAWIQVPVIGQLRDWISQVWSLAGARALLIGVSLGAVTVGLRVLIGIDRPYEG